MTKALKFGQMLKGMGKAMGKDILPDIVLAKKRKAPVHRKAKNDLREKRLENKIILNLKLLGYKICKVGEFSMFNSRHTLSGISDLMVFIPGNGVVFLEVKTDTGKQRESQKKFQELCRLCFLRYYVVRSIKEAKEAVRVYKST